MRNPLKKMINPLEMLSQDHETVKTLFTNCERTDPGVKRKLLAEEIFKNLQLHAQLEEEIFYPAIREHLGSEGGTLVREAYREHGEMKELIGQLEQMDYGQQPFIDRLRALRDHVVAHAEKEEERMFPLVETNLPMGELAFAMDKRRVQLMLQTPAPSVIAMFALGMVGIGAAILLFGGRTKGRRRSRAF